jgi:hypothetical protein
MSDGTSLLLLRLSPYSSVWAEHDHLVADGVLGANATWLLERASGEVALFALPWALLMVTGQRAWVALVSLATNLRLTVPPLPPP